MPSESGVHHRDRALVASVTLTGARVNAVVSQAPQSFPSLPDRRVADY